MLLDIGGNNLDLSAQNPLPTAPKSFDENFGLAFDSFRATELSTSRVQNMYDAYEAAGEAYAQKTGQRLQNPYGPTPDQIQAAPEFGIMPQAAFSDDKAAFLTALRKAREQYPDLPDPDTIESGANSKALAAVKAAETAARAGTGGTARFLGSAAAAMTDPINVLATVASIPLGGIAGAGTGAARQILMAAGREAVFNGLSQGAIEAAGGGYRTELGLENHPLANITAAMLGGAVLGGGFEGAAAGFRALRGLDRLDAARVAERSAMDQQVNPLHGVDSGDLHLKALDAAYEAARDGKPFSVTDAVPLIGERELRLGVEESQLRSNAADIAGRLMEMQPVDEAAADTLNRLNTVERQLADATLPDSIRGAMEARRDELLKGTTRDALLAKANPDRQLLTTQAANINQRLNDIAAQREAAQVAATTAHLQSGLPDLSKITGGQSERIPPRQYRIVDGGPAGGLDQTRPFTIQAAREAKVAGPTLATPERDQALVGEAMRVAAAKDPDVPIGDGQFAKATDLLDEATKNKQAADEISRACLLGGGGA